MRGSQWEAAAGGAAASRQPARDGDGEGGGGGGMSVAFVPERLRGKAEVNQETLQRVSAGAAARGRDRGGGPRPLPGPPALLRESRPCQARRRPVAGVRPAVTARSCVLVAGGERPADPVHCGVPEQGTSHRLRAVSERRRARPAPGRTGAPRASQASGS